MIIVFIFILLFIVHVHWGFHFPRLGKHHFDGITLLSTVFRHSEISFEDEVPNIIHARVLPATSLANNPEMSPRSSMPEFYLLLHLPTTLTCPQGHPCKSSTSYFLANNPDMSPRSSMPEFYLLLPCRQP